MHLEECTVDVEALERSTQLADSDTRGTKHFVIGVGLATHCETGEGAPCARSHRSDSFGAFGDVLEWLSKVR